jgi:hypothetical protein
MRKIFLAALAAFALVCPAAADPQRANITAFNLSATSPAAASTVLGTSSAMLDAFSKCVVQARVQGATGGTLDIYIQSSSNSAASTGWYDVAHYTQLAAGAAAAGWVFTLSRGPSTATAPTGTNTADGTPALAANTMVPNALGNALRVVFVAGASTSAGAVQTINVLCSSL